MNRRNFLRGTISVMAIAATLKYTSTTSHQGVTDNRTLVTDADEQTGWTDIGSGGPTMQGMDSFREGDMIRVSGGLEANNGLYTIKSISSEGVATLG